MDEGYNSSPYYNDLYNFQNGAQNDIFVGSSSNIVVSSPAPLAVTSSAAKKASSSSAVIPGAANKAIVDTKKLKKFGSNSSSKSAPATSWKNLKYFSQKPMTAASASW